jgi:hypothetical protein
MTREEYIDIARKAGFEVDNEGKLFTYGDGYLKPNYMGTIIDGIKSAIDIATAIEREACAKVCEELETCSDAEFYGHEFSAAIRARGQA